MMQTVRFLWTGLARNKQLSTWNIIPCFRPSARLCSSAGKWISYAFTISLWFSEAVGEEKTGTANVKMRILCWKDKQKGACTPDTLQSPGCSVCRQPSTGMNTTDHVCPAPMLFHFLLRQSQSSFSLVVGYIQLVYILDQCSDLGVSGLLWATWTGSYNLHSKELLPSYLL